jgi:hypothetical protein
MRGWLRDTDLVDDEILDRQVYVEDRYMRFGDLTSADARRLADQFSGLSGGGLEKRVAPAAGEWRKLAELLEEREAETVAALDLDEARDYAERVRVVPPGGSWL